MSASLVGSEMCIRDRRERNKACYKSLDPDRHPSWAAASSEQPAKPGWDHRRTACLLYTSDAADDM
eukprot:5546846-Alexandrium_andersonii.AAC.1